MRGRPSRSFRRKRVPNFRKGMAGLGGCVTHTTPNTFRPIPSNLTFSDNCRISPFLSKSKKGADKSEARAMNSVFRAWASEACRNERDRKIKGISSFHTLTQADTAFFVNVSASCSLAKVIFAREQHVQALA